MTKNDKYSDFANVEKQRNYLTAEEFPEGPFGSPIRKHAPVENKSTPWKPDQRHYSAFNYEYKSMHQELPRKMPGAHLTHDNPDQDEQQPYKNLTGD